MQCFCALCSKEFFKDKEGFNDLFFELIDNIDTQEIANFVLSTYDVQINTARIKWCITYAKNRKSYINFFFALQNYIRNKKFPYPSNQINLKIEQLDEQSKAMIKLNKSNAHYPQTLIKDFCNKFNFPVKFITE